MRKPKITNRTLVWTFLNIWLVPGWAQIPIEISAGHAAYYYQHSFAAKFNPEKPIGFFHTSSVLIPYDKNRGNEIMSQSYVSYALNKYLTSGVGSIFTPLARVRPSFFFQYFQKKKTISILVFPRIDIWSEPTIEMMGFFEYRGAGRQNMKIYARLQYMTTWNLREHVRSYQYVRTGVDIADMQFGLAVNIDQYGRFATSYNNIGFFVRKVL